MMLSNEESTFQGLQFTPGLKTTAMGILPHEDVDRALELVLTLDIPFWPQLPNVSFHEDMYVQSSENFPGIRINDREKKIGFDTTRFYEDLQRYAERSLYPAAFDITEAYSLVYRKFLKLDLSSYAAIRGQITGPVSFGLKILDENNKPIIYNDDIRTLIFDFIRLKTSRQYEHLKEKNPNAFMFVDEPGLEFIFSGLSGYTPERAREDFASFFQGIDAPKGIHLCGNPDWDFLLSLDMHLLSFDSYLRGELFVNYIGRIKQFLEKNAVISWGIVPTGFENFDKETIHSLISRLEALWDTLAGKGIDRAHMIERSLLAPATCCLVNPDKTLTVEKAYQVLREISLRLRERYHL